LTPFCRMVCISSIKHIFISFVVKCTEAGRVRTTCHPTCMPPCQSYRNPYTRVCRVSPSHTHPVRRQTAPSLPRHNRSLDVLTQLSRGFTDSDATQHHRRTRRTRRTRSTRRTRRRTRHFLSCPRQKKRRGRSLFTTSNSMIGPGGPEPEH
jgi:hypothetical protein